MFKSLFNRMFPITLSRGLEIVQGISNQDSETPEWYGKAVNMFMTRYGNIRVIDVTPQMVAEWSKSLDTAITIKNTPYSEWSKNSYRRAIRAFFNHLAEIGHIDHPSPTARFRVPNPPKRTPKHVQPEEAERIIQCAQINTRDYAITLMLYDTGCRVSDLATMKLSALHIEEYRSLSHLKEQEKELSLLAREIGLEHMLKGEYIGLVRGKIIVIGKGQKGRKKPRFVFFGDKTARAVRDYIKIRPYHAPDDLWLTHTGDPLSIHSFYHAFKQIAKAAGVNCSPHSLRHTFAFRLIRNGADPKIVQELLGHEELSTTMQYYNLSDSELWQAHQEFSKF